jgi:hypothetical protein
VVDRALEADRAHATAEFLAEFRTDVEGFVSLEVVEACIGDYREMPPASSYSYCAFVDPSGGSSYSFTVAIAHKVGDQIVVDAVCERRPPFSPEDVVAEFAELLKLYRVSRITGDRYAGEFPRELFRKWYLVREQREDKVGSVSRSLTETELREHRAAAARPARQPDCQPRAHCEPRRSGHDALANAVAGAAAQLSRYAYDHTMAWTAHR